MYKVYTVPIGKSDERTYHGAYEDYADAERHRAQLQAERDRRGTPSVGQIDFGTGIEHPEGKDPFARMNRELNEKLSKEFRS